MRRRTRISCAAGSRRVVPKTPLTYRNLAVFRAEPGSRFDIPSWSGHNGTSYSLDVVAGVVTSTQPGGSIY